MIAPKKIIISRTDSIGDVVLTLPMAGVLKQFLPDTKIVFLGRTYTRPIIDTSKFVDEFINWDEIEKLDYKEQKKKFSAIGADCIIHVFPKSTIAKLAAAVGIRYRIGTSSRLFHWLYCNKLVRLSRKNSNLHEAQLNLKLLKPIIGEKEFSLGEIPGYYGLTKVEPLFPVPVQSPARDLTDSDASPTSMPLSPQASREKRDAALTQGRLNGDWGSASPSLLDKSRFNLILHPKSKGNGREWGLENFSALIKLLPSERYKIFISGTKEDGEALKNFLAANKNAVTDITGQMNLPTFISFIKNADGLIASGTGPVHIAAALGINTLGIFPPIRPIFPQRWAPLGIKATYLVKEGTCSDCRLTLQCHCMNEITPQQVYGVMNGWRK